MGLPGRKNLIERIVDEVNGDEDGQEHVIEDIDCDVREDFDPVPRHVMAAIMDEIEGGPTWH